MATQLACDAVGGSFSLSFRGAATAAIAWDAPLTAADAATLGAVGTSLQERLEALPTVYYVAIALNGSADAPLQRDTATGLHDVVCRGYDSAAGVLPKSILITFTAVPGAAGALPPLIANAEALVGNKVVAILGDGSDGLSRTGIAPLTGTFSLAFRGYATAPIASDTSGAALSAPTGRASTKASTAARCASRAPSSAGTESAKYSSA